MSDKKPKEVASVAAFNEAGELLFGKRRDSGRWNMAGGHLEPGESPKKAAIRELLEEAALKPKTLESLGSEELHDGKLIVHSFKATVSGKPTGKNDPDEECEEWRFVDVSDGIPEEIANSLHNALDVTLMLLGLQEWDDEEEPLEKAEVGDLPFPEGEGPDDEFVDVKMDPVHVWHDAYRGR